MDPHLLQHLFEIDRRHWWYRARRRILLELLPRAVVDAPPRPRVADLGCGTGALLEDLAARDYLVQGLDASPEAVALCVARGVPVVEGSLPDRVPLEPGTFDAVVLGDILEHVRDDARALDAALRLLRPGGAALITVPAHPWLWSAWDEANHHVRRYTRPELAALLRGSGARVELLTWYNCFLFPVLVAYRMLGRLRASRGPPGDDTVPFAPLNALLEAIFSSERALVGTVPLPFGASLLALLRRPGR